MFRFLGRWSLELTGCGIIAFHTFLSEEKQMQYQAGCYALVSAARTARYYYTATRKWKEGLAEESVDILAQLAAKNRGLYLRMAQRLSDMKEAYPQFTQLGTKSAALLQAPDYERDVKPILETHFSRPNKQTFDKLITTPYHVGAFGELYKGVLLEDFQDVLVRVQRKHAHDQVEWDAWFLQKFLHKAIDDLGLDNETVTNLQTAISETKEISKLETNLQGLAKFVNEKRSSLQTPRLSVPFHYENLAGARVGVRQYLEGLQFEELPKRVYKSMFITSMSKVLANLVDQGVAPTNFHFPGRLVEAIKNGKKQEMIQLLWLNPQRSVTLNETEKRVFTSLWGEKIGAKLKQVQVCKEALHIIKDLNLVVDAVKHNACQDQRISKQFIKILTKSKLLSKPNKGVPSQPQQGQQSGRRNAWIWQRIAEVWTQTLDNFEQHKQ